MEIRCYVRKDSTAKEHSPYWYFRYHEGGKQRTLYLGKTDDPEADVEVTVLLPEDRMPEAEVALRLAFHLLDRFDSHGSAEVAIDGAMVRIGQNEIFPIEAFMTHEGWEQTEQTGRNAWQGSYEKGGSRLTIHARSGVGDVVALVGSERIRAECKGGPLVVKAGSPEYPRLRQALGQLLTVERVEAGDVMVAAVPRTDRFLRLARNWQPRPLLARSGIRIVLVGRNGITEGL